MSFSCNESHPPLYVYKFKQCTFPLTNVPELPFSHPPGWWPNNQCLQLLQLHVWWYRGFLLILNIIQTKVLSWMTSMNELTSMSEWLTDMMYADSIDGVCYVSFSLSSFYRLSRRSDSAPDATSFLTDYSSTCYIFRIYTYFRFQVFFLMFRLLHVLPFTLPHAFTFLSTCSGSVHDFFQVTMTFYIFMFYLRYAPDSSRRSI